MKRTTLLILTLIATFAMPLAAQADYATTVLADNPLGYWQFEDADSLSVAADSSGNGLDATYAGSGAVGLEDTGLGIGNAATFSNTTDAFVALPGTWGGSATPSMTFELWFNTSSTANAQGMLGPTEYGTHDEAVMLSLNGGNVADSSLLIVRAANQDGNISTDYWSANGIPINTWHHLAYTIDAANGNTKAYVDGVLRSGLSFGTFGHTYENLAAGALQVGQVREGWDYHFIGQIADVAIYDSVLSDATIANHYAVGIAPVPEPGTMFLLLSAIGSLLIWRRFK